MAEKTESKSEALNRLFKENGLLPEDIHKHNHYTIITRAGIEKIQAKNRVSVHYEPVVMERDFCVVKGVFSKEGVPDLETFGSASKETSQNKYYPEMAEKRCLSRGVLKICRFYELGVFGEDEADDFKKQPEPANVPIQERKAVAEKAIQEAVENTSMATEQQKEQFKELLMHDAISHEVRIARMQQLNSFTQAEITKKIAGIKSVIRDYERAQEQAA